MTDIIQELRSVIDAAKLPWEEVPGPDYSEILDALGNKVALTTYPETILSALHALPALLDRLEAAERGVDFLDMRRPIKGIECRSNEEVFAIMADRIRLAEAGHYRLPAIREVKP
ncbi:hypothetical protein BV87_16035 [Sphingobium yanoikuyae]|uniref:Uncharacterized protein n=2 Tax=Sphingobium yanoikuyae TaxID=13690 RepID=A0A0J9D3C4_SPHYA|nr:hypothetical protein BV87_16035 [Sphingobium yanoikuyae]KMW31947.1 hypothetical protein BV87_20850 [Sphingobium yanoikuyae]